MVIKALEKRNISNKEEGKYYLCEDPLQRHRIYLGMAFLILENLKI